MSLPENLLINWFIFESKEFVPSKIEKVGILYYMRLQRYKLSMFLAIDNPCMWTILVNDAKSSYSRGYCCLFSSSTMNRKTERTSVVDTNKEVTIKDSLKLPPSRVYLLHSLQ